MGSTDDTLNGFTIVPSVTEIIFFDTFVTLICLSFFGVRSLYSFTESPGRIKYSVVGVSFDCSALCVFDSDTIVSNSVPPTVRASNPSIFFHSFLMLVETLVMC